LIQEAFVSEPILTAPARSRNGTRPRPAADPRAPQTRKVAPAAAEKTPRARTTRGAAAENPLRDHLAAFVRRYRDGWDHESWLSLLTVLRDQGVDVTNEAAIGQALERERLGMLLRELPGSSARAATALVKRYGSVWNLAQADPDSLALPGGAESVMAQEIAQRYRSA
jgi:hypothetical protein